MPKILLLLIKNITIIFSKDLASHKLHVETILRKFDSHNIKLKKEKCVFYANEIEFCGMEFLEDQVKISKEKIDKIQRVKTPQCTKELQQILGFFNYFNYFNKFIPNYSSYVGPMYSKNKFEWNVNKNSVILNWNIKKHIVKKAVHNY